MSDTGTLLGDLRLLGKSLRSISDDEIARVIAAHAQQNKYGDAETAMLRLEYAFAESWVDAGAVVYELTHNIAALFALTSAPQIDWTRMPHNAFVIKAPRALFPIDTESASADTWIFVWSKSVLAFVVPDRDTTAAMLLDYSTGDSLVFEKSNNKTGVLCNRFLANTVAFISQHRECVHTKGVTKNSKSVFSIRSPRDVVITKQFRDAAIAVVNSESLASTRRALAHVVRGHWRNQAVGPALKERRLVWIRPHRRGDESLGRVVQRIEAMHKEQP